MGRTARLDVIHTFWQFPLIALAAATLQRSLRRGSARARYAAGVILFGAMAVAPCVTYGVVDDSRPGGVKPARVTPLRTPDEMASDDACGSCLRRCRNRKPVSRRPEREAAEPACGKYACRQWSE